MNKNNKKSGYAILFTLVIISIITSLSIGVANSVYKQIILSSLAHDSQIAFYAADTAAECAIYASEFYPGGLTDLVTNSPWDCGVDDEGNNISVSITQPDPAVSIYELRPLSILDGSCFFISIDKTAISGETVIEIKGYNTCVSSNPRQVERGIRVEYQ
jgi:hypothetical protein